MRFSTAIALALPIAVAHATIFNITVAGGGALTYDPSSVTAVAGDTVNFVFTSGSHTVTRSTFDEPCKPMAGEGAIDSGFRPVADGATQFESWGFTISDVSQPIWMMCNRAPHCAKGMVFAINPTPERTFNAFQLAASSSDGDAPAASGSPSGSGEAAAPSTAAGAGSGAIKTGAASTLVLAAVGIISSMVF